MARARGRSLAALARARGRSLAAWARGERAWALRHVLAPVLVFRVALLPHSPRLAALQWRELGFPAEVRLGKGQCFLQPREGAAGRHLFEPAVLFAPDACDGDARAVPHDVSGRLVPSMNHVLWQGDRRRIPLHAARLARGGASSGSRRGGASADGAEPPCPWGDRRAQTSLSSNCYEEI